MKFNPARSPGFTLLEIMIVVAIIGLIMAIAIPNFAKTRSSAKKNICIEQLSQIESAKQQWGVEVGRTEGDLPADAELFGAALYMKQKPTCPGGGNYEILPIGIKATCSINGHSL